MGAEALLKKRNAGECRRRGRDGNRVGEEIDKSELGRTVNAGALRSIKFGRIPNLFLIPTENQIRGNDPEVLAN